MDKNGLLKLLVFGLLIALVAGAAFYFAKKKQSMIAAPLPAEQSQWRDQIFKNETQMPVMQSPQSPEQSVPIPRQTVDPIDGALIRITKKPFGIFITPQTSSVQPERFRGYHTGVDLETTQDEQNIDVPVRALCSGKLLSDKNASGYGGVAVESCTLDGQVVTVIYGHIRLSSVSAKIGTQLKAGDFLADLGKGFSQETDGERRHLHLAIHKGNSIDILGYVPNKSQLSDWLDPAQYLD